jgi:hypothetical protein
MPALAEVPRVPVSDDSMTSEGPTYRDLWLRIRDELPKKGRKTDQLEGPPKLPKELQGAIHSLHSNYARQFEAWDKDKEEFFGATPPVFIVVCGRCGAGFCAPSGTRATARLLGRGWGGGRAGGANPRETSKPRQGREGRQPTPVDSSRFQRRARGGGSPHPPPSQQRAICPCGVCLRQDRKRNNSHA